MPAGQRVDSFPIRHGAKLLGAMSFASLVLTACATGIPLVAHADSEFVIDCGDYKGTWSRWEMNNSKVDCSSPKPTPIRLAHGKPHGFHVATPQAIWLKVSDDGKTIRECDDSLCKPGLKKTPSVSIAGNRVRFLTKEISFLRDGYRGALTIHGFQFAKDLQDGEPPQEIRARFVQGLETQLMAGSGYTQSIFSIEKSIVRLNTERGSLGRIRPFRFCLRTIDVQVTPPPDRIDEGWYIEHARIRNAPGIATVRLVKTAPYHWTFDRSKPYAFIIDDENRVIGWPVPLPPNEPVPPPPPSMSISPIAPRLCGPK